MMKREVRALLTRSFLRIEQALVPDLYRSVSIHNLCPPLVINTDAVLVGQADWLIGCLSGSRSHAMMNVLANHPMRWLKTC